MSDSDNVDVIVVGGGVSGLSAAHQLLKKDPSIRVIVLEAKGRVGGRTFATELKTASGSETFDLGGQWVGTCQPQVMEMIKELGLDVYRQYTQGTKCMQLGSDDVKTYKSDIPAMSVLSLVEFFFLRNKLNSMIAMVPIEDPSRCPYAEQWDSMTVQSFCNDTIRSKEIIHSLEAACRTIFATELSEMSLLYFLAYCNAAGGLDPVILADETSGQEYKIKGGAAQISKILASKLGDDKVLLNQPVTKIEQSDNGATVHTLPGRVFHCSKVIIASPPHQTVNIVYDPPLPSEKANVLQRMAVGSIIKILVTYQKPFWRNNGYSGEIVTYGGKSYSEGCSTGPLCIAYDATTSKDNPALVAFIGGQQQREYSKLSSEERRNAVLKSFAECLGEEAFDYLDYAEKDWTLEPYSGGGPVCVGTPGIFTKLVPGLRSPFLNLHFAGTESATVWCGFINGGIQSGQRAAHEILYNLRPQAVTKEDLTFTCYGDGPKDKPVAPPEWSKTMKVGVGLGAACVLGYAANKAFARL